MEYRFARGILMETYLLTEPYEVDIIYTMTHESRQNASNNPISHTDT